VIFLPDTNVFSRYFRGDDAALNARFARHWQDIALSVIVLAELEYGAQKSGVPAHRRRVDALVLGCAVLESWTSDDAACYGRVRADLERQGAVIGSHDMQIAAQAIRLGATCITHNRRHFACVPGLKTADWQSVP